MNDRLYFGYRRPGGGRGTGDGTDVHPVILAFGGHNPARRIDRHPLLHVKDSLQRFPVLRSTTYMIIYRLAELFEHTTYKNKLLSQPPILYCTSIIAYTDI